MALIDWAKSQHIRDTRKASARPDARAKLNPALEAFFRGRSGKSKGFAGTEISGSDHIALTKDKKVFG